MSVHPRALDYTESLLPGRDPARSGADRGHQDRAGPQLRLLHRHDALHRLQGLRGRVQGMERPAGGRIRADRPQLRQYRRTLGATTWRHVAFIEKIGDGDGDRATEMPPFQSNWLMMSDVCKHCSPAPCLEACPDRRALPHRVRHRRRAAGHLQRLRLLRAGLPVRRRRAERSRRQGAQMHALLRPPERRAGAGLRQSLPDRFDPVRRAVRAARPGAEARRELARARRKRRLSLRRA